MRIISGKARGVRLKSVPGDTTRPITDKTKEALFNILGGDIQGARFLDLFSGTGSVGIEALSRGASYVRMIDQNQRAIKTIRTNLSNTHLDNGGVIVHGDAFKEIIKTPDCTFDFIYNAPPQYKELWKKVVCLIDQYPEWLEPDGWLITQIHPVEYNNLAEEDEIVNLVEFDKRKYGSTLLIFYKKK